MNHAVEKKKLILYQLECLEEEQLSEEPEDNVNWQQKKLLKSNRNIDNISSSLYENNYKEIAHINK